MDQRKLSPAEVQDFLREQNFGMHGERVAVVMDPKETTYGGVIERVDTYTSQPPLGYVAYLGDSVPDSFSETHPVGTRVFVQTHGLTSANFHFDGGTVSLAIMNYKDVYARWEEST